MPSAIEGRDLFLDVGVTGETRRRTITEADVVGFAGLSGDWHPLHTDAVFAASGQFGARIAHGFLVLSIASGLLSVGGEAPLNDDVKAFYGLDKVRLVRPTYMGDSLSVRWRVTERTHRGSDRYLARVASEVINQSGQTVAAFELLLLIGI